MKKRIKQHNIPWLGALVDSLYTSLPLLSIINFVSILTVLYATTKGWLLEWVPWITLWMFLLFLGSLVVFSMVMVYKFVIPSLWTWRQEQMFGYESGLRNDVKALGKEIQELRKELRGKLK